MNNENYIAKLGLEFNPFMKNSKDVIIPNSEYNEAAARCIRWPIPAFLP